MLALYLFLISAVSGEYVFTLPREMEAGATTSFCLLLSDMELDGFKPEKGFTVTVRLKYKLDDYTRPLTEVQQFDFGVVNIDGEFQQCHEVYTPSVDGRFSAVVNASMTYYSDEDLSTPIFVKIFEAERFIDVRRTDLITLVQTDKPIYKPGQTVKFRVMTMDYKLMSRTDGYQQITIETPNGLRVMQWNDVPSPNGLVSLEMPLSSDPLLGSWLIKVVYGSKEITQSFTVDEYVLPKFEVTVTPPKYLLPTTQDIDVTVCAKYTYGKSVKGQLKMKICYKHNYPYYYIERPCANIIKTIDGCDELIIDAESIKLGHTQYASWGSLKIEANVTEDATGIELSGSSDGPYLSFNPLNLRIEDDSDNHFKPGFPYHGRVIVTNPDGSPAIGEPIRVEGNTYDSKFNWIQNFTTDDNGIVHFVITEFESGLGYLNLHADAIVYDDDKRYTSDELYYRTYTPQAYLRLTKWFSPSNSYLYIPDVDQAVEYNSMLPLDVFYTAEVGADYKFMAIVKAGNKITYTKETKIKAEDSVYNIEILSVDDSMVLQKVMKPTPPPTFPPPPPGSSEVPPLPEIPPEPVPFGEAELEPVFEEVIVPETAQILGDIGEDIRKKREVEPNLVGYFKLEIPVTQDMSPSAKVLVFYMRTDKEVVASSLEFKIKSCFRNKVTMSFDKTTLRPGTDVKLNLGASANSTCFVGMMDKSVSLLAGNNQLKPSQVFEKVRQVSRPYHYNSYGQEDRAYCEKEAPPRGPEDYSYYSYYTSEGVDAIQAFRNVEMWVETDAVLETRPCTEHIERYYYMGRGRLIDDIAGLREPGPSGLSGPLPVSLERPPNIDVSARKQPDTSEGEPESEVEIRTLFPETWLWDIVSLGEDGTFTYKTQIPDTITEWVGNTVCTHESDGVGVTEMTGVTAFKPFFVSLTLPYSAIRGEVLPVLVTVFNYLSDCITLELQFRETEGFEFSGKSATSRQFCLCGGVSESTKFHIIPTVIGEIDLEVIAVSIDDIGLCEDVVLADLAADVSDGVQRQLLIEAEGVPLDQTKSSYICVKESEILTEVININLPPAMVPDSERATVSVVGDIMGPTLSNLKNLLRMPYGCGEQNMASWIPNLSVLQYLESTDQLTEKLEEEAEGYMRVGYQRQLNYRHNDNSYSAWGENSYGNATGSSWLTAFVVKAMAQSSAYISIDKEDVVRSARWLVNNQQDNGCFPRIGRTFSSYLKGGLDGDNIAGLTAFTLTALFQADLGEAFMTNISNGFSCLDEFDLATTDTYTLTLMLYAYTLYDNEGTRRADVMKQLLLMRVEKDGLKFWRRDDEDSETEDDYWWYRAPSAEVEMTSYVLLSMLEQGQEVIGDAQPIVQWLTKQRNPYGGFSSTQDTVVALQALSEFGKLTYSGDTAVTIEVKNQAIGHVFSVTPSNSLVYQSIDVYPTQGAVEIATSGAGCALVQMNMKYNVYEEEDSGPAFDVKVNVFRSRARGRNCAVRTLEVCASYLKGGVSNMAIAEVKMPTGWNPVSSTLDELLRSDKLQKYEVDKNYVQLYFDEFSINSVCVDFDVEQEIEMSPKAALVKVYDYYETRYSATANYTIKTTCGTKEEISYDNQGLDCTIMQCRVDDSKESEVTCPSCLDTIENEDIEQLFCEANKVYKAVVRRNGDYSIKLKADLRIKWKLVLDKFVNYEMGERCTCQNVEYGPESKAFIFARSEALDSTAAVLTLEDGETLIPYEKSYERLINQLSSRKILCEKLKRLRRSRSSKTAARLLRLRRKLGIL